MEFYAFRIADSIYADYKMHSTNRPDRVYWRHINDSLMGLVHCLIYIFIFLMLWLHGATEINGFIGLACYIRFISLFVFTAFIRFIGFII